MFYFHPYLGKWSNLTNIFQVGWNHQLEKDGQEILDFSKYAFLYPKTTEVLMDVNSWSLNHQTLNQTTTTP